jgi:hypothetical protein
MGSRDRDDSIRDRDKKSFSELDKQRREGRRRRDDDAPAQKKLERSQAYSDYKRQLNAAFDGGGLPEAVKQKLGDTELGKQAKARKAAAAAIVAAVTSADILAAATAYRDAHGFPEDEAALGKILELDDEPAWVLEALQTIGRLAEAGTLSRAKSLKGRIKAAQMTVDDDDVVAAAVAVLKKIS